MSARRPRRHQVFISYSSRDRATADAVRSHLQSNGIACWMAPDDIIGGSDWAVAIIEAIDQSQALLLILSQASNHSDDVKREVGRASHKGVPIVPFFIENVTLSKHMEYFLATTHWLGADTRHVELRMAHLLDTVRSLLRAPGSAATRARSDSTSASADAEAHPDSAAPGAAPASVAAALSPDKLSGDVGRFETSFLTALRPILRFPAEDPAVTEGAKTLLAAIAALAISALGVLFNLQGVFGALLPGATPESFVYSMFPMVRLTAIVASVASLAGNLGLVVGGHRMYAGTADGSGITMAAVRWLAMVLGGWFVLSMLFTLTTGPSPVRGAVVGATLTTAFIAAIQIGIVWKLTAAVKR